MRIPKYRFFILVAFLGASLFFVFQMGFLRGKAPRLPSSRGFELLDTLISLIKNDYLEEREPAQTTDGALRGLVNSLDPLSAYLDPELAGKYSLLKDSDFHTGLIVFKKYGSFPLIVGIIEGSPASSSALKPGDIISAVNGRNTLVMSLTEVELVLKATEDSPARLKILRGNDTFETSLAAKKLGGGGYQFLHRPGKSAYLRLQRFTPNLVSKLKKEIVPLLDLKRDYLVIDLRNTVEDEYQSACEFLNLFIKSPSIGYFLRRNGEKKNLTCEDDSPLVSVETVIWVNGGTIGAAEMTAAVLQELKGAKVIGFKTPGLSAERYLYPLENGAALLLSVGAFNLNSGKSLWGDGVKPDVALKPEETTDNTYWEKTLPLFPANR